MLIPISIQFPFAAKFGADREPFGLVLVWNPMIGAVCAPVRVVLYVVTDIARISFERTSSAILDFLSPPLTVLAAKTRWSPVAAGLPALLLDR